MTMETYGNHIWLVVVLPLWKMMEFVNWDGMTFPSEWNIKFHGSSHHQPASSYHEHIHPHGNHIAWLWKPYGNHMETYPYLSIEKSLNCPRPLRSGWPRCRPSPSAGRWGLPTISCRRSGCPPKWCDLRWRSTTWMRMSRFCRYITLWLCQNSYWTWP